MAKTFSITKPLGGDRRARSANQKLKLLLLRQYLERNSDEAHPVTTAQLLEYLASEGISAERKSIYSDLEALQSFGLDLIRVRDGNITCWYIGERVFQLPELRLLADSVQSSRFITRKKSLELIAKLEGLTSVHQAKELRRQVVVKNRIKAMNESIYYLVDELHTAINGRQAHPVPLHGIRRARPGAFCAAVARGTT